MLLAIPTANAARSQLASLRRSERKLLASSRPYTGIREGWRPKYSRLSTSLLVTGPSERKDISQDVTYS